MLQNQGIYDFFKGVRSGACGVMADGFRVGQNVLKAKPTMKYGSKAW